MSNSSLEPSPGAYERTVRRKVREMLLATCVEKTIPKPQVADIYIMAAHYGWGMQGVAGACRALGYELSCLSPYQAAALIARLKHPQPRVLHAKWEARLQRRAEHIQGLISRGWGSGQEAQTARGPVNATVPATGVTQTHSSSTGTRSHRTLQGRVRFCLLRADSAYYGHSWRRAFLPRSA